MSLRPGMNINGAEIETQCYLRNSFDSDAKSFLSPASQTILHAARDLCKIVLSIWKRAGALSVAGARAGLNRFIVSWRGWRSWGRCAARRR